MNTTEIAATEAQQSTPTDSTLTQEKVPPHDLGDPSLYLNRELTWLEFNRRVLHEADDERTPLLERVKFLAIVRVFHEAHWRPETTNRRRRHHLDH
jgi:polyphosphate kinase